MKLKEEILHDLQTQGYSYRSYLPPEQVNQFLEKFEEAHFRQARIGEKNEDLNVRRDHIHWLEDHELPVFFKNDLMSLKTEINRRLFLGLDRHEFHFSMYPEGAFYKKHVDNFQGKNSRVLSLILYLTSHLNEGELVLYQDDVEIKKILPLAGWMMIFLSQEFPHEVLPTKHPRKSLTGWIHQR